MGIFNSEPIYKIDIKEIGWVDAKPEFKWTISVRRWFANTVVDGGIAPTFAEALKAAHNTLAQRRKED